MSRHETTLGNRKIVVGWDQPMQTYFGQEHDMTAEPDTQPQVWVGTQPRRLYELEDLRRAMAEVAGAREFINDVAVALYGDRDDGR